MIIEMMDNMHLVDNHIQIYMSILVFQIYVIRLIPMQRNDITIDTTYNHFVYYIGVDYRDFGDKSDN